MSKVKVKFSFLCSEIIQSRNSNPIKETKLNYLVIDYDIKIYVLNTNRVLGKKLTKLKENYNINAYPTLIILDNDKIYYNNVIDISDIPKILDEQGFKSR